MIEVLVVEDDLDLGRIACRRLEDDGYVARGVATAREALAALAKRRTDLIVSDIMLPGMDGFEFAETVRRLDCEIPILFMTARDDFASKRRGFRLGVDDYMVKPVDLEELALRVGALLRRARIAADKRVTVGDLVLDADAMTATVGGRGVAVTVREFNLLFKLLSNPNRAYTRAQLMDEFWDPEATTGPRSVDVYITRLRDKFASSRGFAIVTVHGLGYKAVLT
ncbi:MAG: response regulator transcription factor [Bifidobacteriaceae bacterium]|nr:response regulator transcription factor [Bifidobacteriaceae bacterium]